MAHIRKLKSGKWQATVRHPSGQRWSKTDPLKRVVQQWASDTEAAMRRGDFIDPAAGKMTLGDWWVKWSATRRVESATAAKNTSHWRVHVEPAFGRWPLATIKSWDVEKWVSDMVAAKVGPPTVAASLSLLTHMLNAAVKHQLVGANPASLVSAPTVPKHKDRFLSRDEAARLLDQFDGVNRLFVEVLLGTGLRWEEATGLDGRHVNFLRRTITVEQALGRDRQIKPPKTRAGYRDVPLTDELTEGLSRHVVNLAKPVFQQPNGERFDYSNWRSRVWVPAVKAANLADPQPTPHDCRHTYASWLGEQGVSPQDLAALLGHSDWRMVQRYVHSSEARMDRARDALGVPSNKSARHSGKAAPG
jgi:integrase